MLADDKTESAFCIIENGLLSSVSGEKKTNIDNMRKFHNWVKNHLIEFAVKKSSNESLLDLAVGRGGDLNKWKNNQIQYVFGIDNDRKSIFASIRNGDSFDGAIARLRGMNIRKPYVRFNYLSVLDPEVLNKINSLDNNRLYSIVSCQFAFHYFTKDPETLNHTINLISSKLKPNGYFIATFTNGELIKENIKNGNVILPSLVIKSGKVSNSYIFEMKSKDSETSNTPNYFELIDQSVEYITSIDTIINTAKNYNLEFIMNKNFNELYAEFKQTKNFRPLGFQEMLISFLNTTLVLKKN